MTVSLNSIIIKPENGIEIKNAIILLHGYGGDGGYKHAVFKLEETHA